MKDAISGEPYAIEMGGKEYWQKMLDTANSIKSKKEIEARQGNLYHSRIHAHPDHFLDWDKPLSEQSEHVREALRALPYADKIARYSREGEPVQRIVEDAASQHGLETGADTRGYGYG